MNSKVKKRRSAEKATRQETFSITVDDPKLLEVEKLINQRKHITRKIRNLPNLKKQFEIENSGVTLKQLSEHLQKEKSAIDKALAKHARLSKSKKTSRLLPALSTVVMERRGPMSIEELLAKMYPTVYPPDPMDFRPFCQTVNGRAIPELIFTGIKIDALEDLNHNSSAHYYVCRRGYSMGELVWNIAAWLNDDAGIGRFDYPDSYGWTDYAEIYLCGVECDSKIVASIGLRFEGHIASKAKDHNEIRQYVYVDHSDENGNLSANVAFGDKYNLNIIDLSGEIGLPEGSQGPIIDSGWVTANMSFNVKSGIMTTFRVAPCTELIAEDGTLKIVGDWKISDLVYSITPV